MKKRYGLASLLVIWMMSGCEKESDDLFSRHTRFTYPYTNYCGGYLSMLVPNIFTPNDDGSNDTWRPFFGGNSISDSCEQLIPEAFQYDRIKFIEILVHDADGKQLFHHADTRIAYDKEWTGNYPGSNIAVPQGTYFWYIKLTDLDNKNHTERGQVSITR